MNKKLARVNWRMGQTLLPEHLMAQEDALLEDVALRFRMQGLPFYGIASLKLIEDLLREGLFSIKEIEVFMPSGKLIVVPGNAQAAPFNLNNPGKTRVPLYLHVLDAALGQGDAGDIETEDEASIPRRLNRVALSSEQDYPDAGETLKLAEFEKEPDGAWNFSADYIPPLLKLGTSPFLQKELRELSESLENFQYNLYMDAVSYLSGDALTAVKQCLRAIYSLQRLIGNVFAEVHLHPFYLYEGLLSLYTDVCYYRAVAPENVTMPYTHNNLAFIYRIIGLLEKQLQIIKSKPPYLPFEFKDNIYRVALPDEVRKASGIYLLVQKNLVIQQVSLADVKLASLSRLPTVHKMALKGIPFKKVEHPSFRHAFGAEVEFYLISEGEEWDYALNEKNVAFYNRPELKDTDFYLFWRS